MTCSRPQRTAPGRTSNQGPLGPISDALTTAPLRPLKACSINRRLTNSRHILHLRLYVRLKCLTNTFSQTFISTLLLSLILLKDCLLKSIKLTQIKFPLWLAQAILKFVVDQTWSLSSLLCNDINVAIDKTRNVMIHVNV